MEVEVITTILEVVALILEDVVEEEDITTKEEEAEVVTTIIMVEDSKNSSTMEIQEKITKQLSASSLNNQANANLETNVLLPMVMSS
jgi:hypothetical protein